ncbi:isoprenyl transferase [bacterium]|nr:isoprenyl transferase [bacterium]
MNLDDKKNRERLLNRGQIPQHIAIIMDGNGRWAKQRGLPRIAGHREGIKAVRDIVEVCGELGIQVLTLYTFSTENWRRPKEEVSALMSLLLRTLRKEIDDLIRNNVRLMAIGDMDKLPQNARNGILEGIQATRQNTGLILNLALSYGGREEIISAIHRIVSQVNKGILKLEDINVDTLHQYLYTAELPDPDLLIRTSGEFRISNFLLWQLAYTEIYITDVLWPDFRRQDLYRAVEDYQSRERRFGKVSEQITDANERK